MLFSAATMDTGVHEDNNRGRATTTFHNLLAALRCLAQVSKQGQIFACKGRTQKAPAAHMEAGGNERDTVKPLHKKDTWTGYFL